MRTHGKQYQAARQQVPARPHKIEEAVPLIQKVKYTKFDETVEMAVRLGVDPKHSDQMVRGTVVLPHGLGKSKKVLVIANADKQREAREAAAKGRYLKNVTMSSTMGPGVLIDTTHVDELVKH